MGKFTKFARIAEVEFSVIALSTQNLGLKLRIYLIDKSFIDFYFTTRTTVKRFSIHWERIHIDKTVYRLDNTPDKKWRKVKTFPIHFHNKKYNLVIKPPFVLKPKISLENIFRIFLQFTEEKLEDYIDQLDARKLEKESRGRGIPIEKLVKKYSK